jgi:septal ring factor EnvC (AmiA/AmiB activator)
MSTTAERYARLSRCYVQLADQFADLDLEHMHLKRKLVDVLKALKESQRALAELEIKMGALEAKHGEQYGALAAQYAALEAQYQMLKPFELLLQPEAQADLLEAEKAIDLIEETVAEREKNEDPDLSAEEKALAERSLSDRVAA